MTGRRRAAGLRLGAAVAEGHGRRRDAIRRQGARHSDAGSHVVPRRESRLRQSGLPDVVQPGDWRGGAVYRRSFPAGHRRLRVRRGQPVWPRDDPSSAECRRFVSTAIYISVCSVST